MYLRVLIGGKIVINKSLTYGSSNNLGVRNYGISEFQSSSSLQNSVCTYSIPKSPRFKNSADTGGGLYKLPGVLGSGRATGLGYGGRLFPVEDKNAKNSPSPSQYKLKSFVDELVKKCGVSIKGKLNLKVLVSVNT
jgi:hypothetical protein